MIAHERRWEVNDRLSTAIPKSQKYETAIFLQIRCADRLCHCDADIRHGAYLSGVCGIPLRRGTGKHPFRLRAVPHVQRLHAGSRGIRQSAVFRDGQEDRRQQAERR